LCGLSSKVWRSGGGGRDGRGVGVNLGLGGGGVWGGVVGVLVGVVAEWCVGLLLENVLE